MKTIQEQFFLINGLVSINRLEMLTTKSKSIMMDTSLIPRYSLNIMGMVRLKPHTLNMMTPEYMFFQVLKRIPLRILGRHLIWPKNMV